MKTKKPARIRAIGLLIGFLALGALDYSTQLIYFRYGDTIELAASLFMLNILVLWLLFFLFTREPN